MHACGGHDCTLTFNSSRIRHVNGSSYILLLFNRSSSGPYILRGKRGVGKVAPFSVLAWQGEKSTERKRLFVDPFYYVSKFWHGGLANACVQTSKIYSRLLSFIRWIACGMGRTSVSMLHFSMRQSRK